MPNSPFLPGDPIVNELPTRVFVNSYSPRIENVLSHCDLWLIPSLFIPPSYLYRYSIMVGIIGIERHNVKTLYLFAFHVQVEMSVY